MPLVVALIVISVVVQLMGPSWPHALRYERTGILAGQWWRLLSAHVVHLGWSHLALNSAALLLIAYALGEHLGPRLWLGVTAVSALCVSLGLLLARPEVAWYVGLSGLAHGLFLAGAWGLAQRHRMAGLACLAAAALKIGHEQMAGALAGSAAWLGGEVIVDAHLFGAVGGLLTAWWGLAAARKRPQ
jgi:rhomboid family GlyGly-CTERM serine protease